MKASVGLIVGPFVDAQADDGSQTANLRWFCVSTALPNFNSRTSVVLAAAIPEPVRIRVRPLRQAWLKNPTT